MKASTRRKTQEVIEGIFGSILAVIGGLLVFAIGLFFWPFGVPYYFFMKLQDEPLKERTLRSLAWPIEALLNSVTLG